jgi:hypothetical protein
LSRTRRQGVLLYLALWAVIFPIQTIVVHADNPGDIEPLYFVFNAVILAGGVGLNTLGARLRRKRHGAALGILVLLIGAGGCGSDDDPQPSREPAKPAAQKPAASKAPSELLGTYTTTLKQSDLPANPPPELTDGTPKWELTIANSGGIDDGPVFGIAKAKLGSLEGPSFSVSGDRITLHREECDASGDARFYENEYSFELKGKSLTFSEIKNRCPDKVALTILTSRPWTKVK